MFQAKCTNNLVNWETVREMLFSLKRNLDQKYRNIMWHGMRGGHCDKCQYWDNVYMEHLANVNNDDVIMQEISDEDIIAAAMEVDGTNE